MVNRAPVKWFGGKGRLKKQILPLIPRTDIYVECYGGAGNVLLAREPSPVEVYNDLNNKLVNLMRALRDPKRLAHLRKQLLFTLYSREEFREAIAILKDPKANQDDVAWAFYVSHNQGFSGIPPKSAGSWGRTFKGSKNVNKKTSAWLSLLDLLPEWHRRLMTVQIDSRDAIELIRYWDRPETTFYLDPPYIAETRQDAKVYDVETDDAHHVKLVDTILQCQGAVVLSGYAHALYKPLEDAGWERLEFETVCSAPGSHFKDRERPKRIEVVWRNPRAVELCPYVQKAA